MTCFINTDMTTPLYTVPSILYLTIDQLEPLRLVLMGTFPSASMRSLRVSAATSFSNNATARNELAISSSEGSGTEIKGSFWTKCNRGGGGGSEIASRLCCVASGESGRTIWSGSSGIPRARCTAFHRPDMRIACGGAFSARLE